MKIRIMNPKCDFVLKRVECRIKYRNESAGRSCGRSISGARHRFRDYGRLRNSTANGEVRPSQQRSFDENDHGRPTNSGTFHHDRPADY